MAEDKRMELFNELYPLLKSFEPPLVAKSDIASRQGLYSIKDVNVTDRDSNVTDRTLKEVFFAGLIDRDASVGLFHMPIYTHASEVTELIGADLLATLNGKSCFPIRTETPALHRHTVTDLTKRFAFRVKS